jgi:plasmid stability protein
MANLTLTVDDDLLRRARIRALECGTSVNAIVRDYIESFAGEGEAERGLREFVQSARSSPAGSGSDGRKWRREDLYERRTGGHG